MTALSGSQFTYETPNVVSTGIAQQYGCSLCKYKCHKPANLKLHFQTKKHLQAISSIEHEYICEPCRFSTIKRADYNRHITTQKHKNTVSTILDYSRRNDDRSFVGELDYSRRNDVRSFVGELGYSQRNDDRSFVGELCYSRRNDSRSFVGELYTSSDQMPPEQQTTNTTLEIESKIETLSGVVLEIVKQNTEFQRIIIETQQQTQKQCAELAETCKSVCAAAAPTTVVHNTTTNNHFNLQFFLNVTCKDAINISDFIQGLDIRPEHIERFGRIGFVDGITRILMDGLNSLEKHKRPIHCTDMKRDTMYIRESNQWQKDDENARLVKAIETVEQYNCRAFCKEIAPPTMKDETDMIRYMTVLQEVNGGSSREKNRAKIVKNISKACFVRTPERR